MSEIMDIRLRHHLAQEFYRQQMLQRIPGNSSSLRYWWNSSSRSCSRDHFLGRVKGKTNSNSSFVPRARDWWWTAVTCWPRALNRPTVLLPSLNKFRMRIAAPFLPLKNVNRKHRRMFVFRFWGNWRISTMAGEFYDCSSFMMRDELSSKAKRGNGVKWISP